MADRDRFGGRERDYPTTPIQSGGPGGEFGGSQRLYTGRNPFMTPNDPGMDFGAGPPGGRPRRPGRERPEPPMWPMPTPRPPWGGPERPMPSPSPLWPGPRPMPEIPPGGRMPPWGGPDRPMPRYPNPRLPYPMPDREYPNPRLPYPLEEREYLPAMDYMEEDTSYMGPSPFPRPGQPFPPVGRPPWGGPDDTQWVGQPGGGEGESEFAANSPEWTIWNSIRRKYGADAANRLTSANRGGIMGLI